MGKRSLALSQYQLVAEAYKNGSTTIALAAQYAVSEGTIRTVLKAQGVTSRPRADRASLAHAAAGRGARPLVAFRAGAWPNIEPQAWAKLRQQHTDDALAVIINDALDGCPVPYPDIDDQQARRSFETLVATPLASLFGSGPIQLLRSPSAVQAEYHLALRPPGNKAANQLFCSARWSTPRAADPSILQIWSNSDLRLGICRRFLKLKGTDRLSPSAFRRALCRTGATPSQFNAGAARAVYELVGARDILDFSAGWGDRLVGFCAAQGVRSYTGIDPNSSLHSLYQQLIARYGAGKHISLIEGAAEDISLPEAAFDLVFTSPPYFDTERYASGSAHTSRQSWSRYPTPEAWRTKFLVPVIQSAWKALRVGGVLAVNIADAPTKHGYVPLCHWLQEAVNTCEASKALPTLGMRLQGVNYTQERRAAASGEPIWMWSKGALRGPFATMHSEPAS